MEATQKVVHGVCPVMVGDDASIVSVSVRPDGTGEVLCVRADIKGLPDMVTHVADLDERYGHDATFVVESNGVQVWLCQALHTARPGIAVKPLLRGADKDGAFGMEAMVHAVRGGQLTIASGPNEDVLIRDILNYSPGERATTRLMALWMAYRFATIPS